MAKNDFQLWCEEINVSNGDFIMGVIVSLICGFILGVVSQ